MQVLTPEQAATDLIRTLENDRKVILSKLPDEMRKRFRADKWFNFYSGSLTGSTDATIEGETITVWSNPIGKGYDLYGGWKDGDLKSFCESRKAEGYYKRYMQERRAGRIEKGRIHGSKRIPFLASTVFRIPVLIRTILKKEEIKNG